MCNCKCEDGRSSDNKGASIVDARFNKDELILTIERSDGTSIVVDMGPNDSIVDLIEQVKREGRV